MFDSVHRRTCLHYAAYYGHADCLQAILSAAQSSTVAVSWLVSSFKLILCALYIDLAYESSITVLMGI